MPATDLQSLGAAEKKLFQSLSDREGQVCSRQELLAKLNGDTDASKERLLPVYVGRLRRKLETLGLGTIVAERGQGYRYLKEVPATKALARLQPALLRVAQRRGGFQTLANELMNVLVATIEELADGEGTTPDLSEVAQWAAFLEGADRSVIATSFVQPAAWWDGRAGQRYLVVNQKLRARKVAVRRLYMFDDKNEFERYEYVLREQEKVGVEVRYLLREELFNAPEMQRQAEDAWDIAIVDEEQLIQLPRSMLARTLLSESRFTEDKGAVQSALKSFEQLWIWEKIHYLTPPSIK